MAKFCTNCGHELREMDKFCSECGFPVGDSLIESEAQPSYAARRTRCPNPECPDPNDVQLISALIGKGKLSGTVSDVGYKVVMQSDLSKQLIYVNSSINGWALVLLMLATVPVFIGLSNIVSVVSGVGTGDVGNGVEDLLIALPLLVGVIALLARSKRRNRQTKARWASAYYCNHCGSVFIPGSSEFVPVSRVKDLLA
jgi:hypothetical protein